MKKEKKDYSKLLQNLYLKQEPFELIHIQNEIINIDKKINNTLSEQNKGLFEFNNALIESNKVIVDDYKNLSAEKNRIEDGLIYSEKKVQKLSGDKDLLDFIRMEKEKYDLRRKTNRDIQYKSEKDHISEALNGSFLNRKNNKMLAMRQDKRNKNKSDRELFKTLIETIRRKL